MSQHAVTWTDVQDEVLRRIRAGIWCPGALIPGEIELAREFDCARATVSRALRTLAEDGVLDRRRRAGTRVSLNPVRRATLAIPVIRAEVEARGASYRHVLLARDEVPAPAAVAARMGLAPGAPLVHVRALHLADDLAHCYEDRWIDPATVPGAADETFEDISANEWLVRNAFYSDGEISFFAAAARPDEAEMLSVPEAAALFVLERLTRIGEQPITLVRLAYPPGHRMTTTL